MVSRLEIFKKEMEPSKELYTKEIEDFSKKFDVLINTINDDDFFSRIVALRSLAKLRVATDTPAHKEVYDLLIKVDSKTSETEFLKQVINILFDINK